jgi:hypothetical protein
MFQERFYVSSRDYVDFDNDEQIRSYLFNDTIDIDAIDEDLFDDNDVSSMISLCRTIQCYHRDEILAFESHRNGKCE